MTALQTWETGTQEIELPDPPPGHWRVLSAAAGGEPGPFGRGAVGVRERATGVRLALSLEGSAMTLKPRLFEGSGQRYFLMPQSQYMVADLQPKDPSRACAHCADAGVRLKKCARCQGVRYW